MTLLIGNRLDGRYLLRERIGEGATSTVFRAYDETLGREVAIKRFKNDIDDLGDPARRLSEVRLLAGLVHPGIVTLYDAVLGGEPAFLVMELVEGQTLQERLRRGPLPRRQADEIGAAVAMGLAAVHERGVVHRDVKPANILLPQKAGPSAAKLVDFGIARPAVGATATRAGRLVGTAAYLSPEQARGEVAGPASDVYSLGLVLIEALSGIRPFPGNTLESAAARLTQDPSLSAPQLGPHREFLAAMTSGDPSARPSAAEVVANFTDGGRTRVFTAPFAPRRVEPSPTVAVADARETEPMIAPSPPSATMPASAGGSRRHWRILMPAVVVAGLLLTGGAMWAGLTLAFEQASAAAGQLSGAKPNTAPVKSKPEPPALSPGPADTEPGGKGGNDNANNNRNNGNGNGRND